MIWVLIYIAACIAELNANFRDFLAIYKDRL